MTTANESEYDTTNQTLEQLMDNYPLIADLHVHLLGTGDAIFWREQMSHKPETAVPDEIEKKLCLRSICNKNQDLTFYDLLEIGDNLNAIFEIRAPVPRRYDEEFSPRFSLRQFIASNEPEVLTRLIRWNAERDEKSCVHYAEMSLGAGWFKDPYLIHIIEGIERAEQDYSVLLRLLVAFNRKQIDESIHNPVFLRDLANEGDKKLYFTKNKPICFEKHLEQLEIVKNSIEKSRNLKRYVVGFDIIGREENRPYTPFLLPSFLTFAKDMQKENPNFGFRLHLGEGISPDNDIGYVCLRLGEHYIFELSVKHRFRVRCGHGIGLLNLENAAFNRWITHYARKNASIALDDMATSLKIATIEVNLTSNHFLLNDPGCFSRSDGSLQSHVLGPLLEKRFNVVLGTDDPGIFPEISLRNEFKKAVDNGLIKDKHAFLAMIDESVRANFADPVTLEQLSKIVSERYPGVKIPMDKRKIPRYFLPDSGTIQEIRETEFEIAKRLYKQEGDYHAISEWYNKYRPP